MQAKLSYSAYGKDSRQSEESGWAEYAAICRIVCMQPAPSFIMALHVASYRITTPAVPNLQREGEGAVA